MITGVVRGIVGFAMLSGGIYLIVSDKSGIMPRSINLSAAEIANYLMLGASIITILIALASMTSSEKATKEQIGALRSETSRHIQNQEYWANVKRRQHLNAVIEEIQHDQLLYQRLVEKNKKAEYSQQFDELIDVSMENFLADSPSDNETLNHNVLVLYYMIRLHNNKIAASRTANIKPDSLRGFMDSIAKDYNANTWLFEGTLKLLNEYRDTINLHAPTLVGSPPK